MNEDFWDSLIDKIRENNVVPVVGSRLYATPEGVSFQAGIAESMFKNAPVDPAAPYPSSNELTAFHEVHEAVSRLKDKLPLQKLYESVYNAIRRTTGDSKFVVPVPLRQLAEITDFRLLVALTPDELLVRCLREHQAVTEIVHSPTLPTSEAKDLPQDWQKQPGEAYLLYLFGKARSAPTFAIHDEDVLEYAHNIIARGSQVPSRFFDELQQRNLLLIGCSFPDWLSRFFLRATNRQRLFADSSKLSWLIEPLKPEESLTCFLKAYSKDTEILSDLSPADFVSELHRRWLAVSGAKTEEEPSAVVPQKAMFFVSYSRGTDRVRAENLCRVLRGLGVGENEIWFDRSSIEPGQDFGERILDGIRYCRNFLPLLSVAADQREEAFVFSEWRAANERAATRRTAGMITPIIVDSVFEPASYTAEPVRAWRTLDFGHAPEGEPDPRLRERLVGLIREARSPER